MLLSKGKTCTWHAYLERLKWLAKMTGTYVFAADLFLCKLNLDERTDGGEDLPPRPAFHTPVLLDVFLDAADCQVLDLKNKDIVFMTACSSYCCACEKLSGLVLVKYSGSNQSEARWTIAGLCLKARAPQSKSFPWGNQHWMDLFSSRTSTVWSAISLRVGLLTLGVPGLGVPKCKEPPSEV